MTARWIEVGRVDVDPDRRLEMRLEPSEREAVETFLEPLQNHRNRGVRTQVTASGRGLKEGGDALRDRLTHQRYDPPRRVGSAWAIEEALRIPVPPGSTGPVVLTFLL